ncbi:hypothetical protein EON66_05115 [archaeon]|nr:MAG: hypothetical protein EON66_05115 [archaeon]
MSRVLRSPMLLAGGDLLVVIVDCRPEAWLAADTAGLAAAEAEAAAARAAQAAEGSKPYLASRALDESWWRPFAMSRRATFAEMLAALKLFVASYAMLSRKNKLAVLGYNGREGGFIYPVQMTTEGASMAEPLRPADYAAFIDVACKHLRYGPEGVLAPGVVMEEAVSFDDFSERSKSLPSCMSLALCYQNSQRQTARGLRARILVVHAGEDVAASYIPLINCMYTAQRFDVLVDSMQLGEQQSTVLQQAAHLTGGVHIRVQLDLQSVLLQFMITHFLSERAARDHLLQEQTADINFHGTCFCHKKHVSKAFVCSVCLSVWCREHAVCPTCGTLSTPAGGSSRVVARASAASAPAAYGAGAARAPTLSSAGAAASAGTL